MPKNGVRLIRRFERRNFLIAQRYPAYVIREVRQKTADRSEAG